MRKARLKSRINAILLLMAAGAVIDPDPILKFIVFNILQRFRKTRPIVYLGGFLGSVYCC